MPRKPQKDRTSLVISAVIHALLIGGVIFWAYKTGKLEQMRQAVLQYVKGEKKPEKKPEPIQQKQTAAPKLPPINQGMKAPESSGTRRAVASDAPESHGGSSFFQDTRRQTEGPSTGGSGTARQTNALVIRAPAPPPRVSLAAAGPSTIKQLFAERSRAAGSTEAVGSEQISKSGTSDAGGAVTKVAGASIVDGKFAIIRGLSDRYVTTTFNGGEIPSADPYRRSASLDLFPAQVIDRVVVSKTFTPDEQGTFTGGGVDIVSKSFPERTFASFTFGGGFNTQSTLNPDFLTYKGGGLDWLGMDDGSRALPAALEGTVIPPRIDTTGPNRPSNPNFAFNVQRAELLNELTKEMGTTQFAPYKSAPPFDHNFALAMGDTTHLFGHPFGVFGGLNYKREFKFYDDGIVRRYIPGENGTFIVSKDYQDTLATDVVNWAGMTSLAYQWQDHHDVAFNFLFNQNGQDYVRTQVGTQENNPTATFYQHRLQFTERTLSTFQFKGEDRFPELAGATLNWLAAISDTSQDEPDARFFNYLSDGGAFETSDNSLPDPADPTRYFRTLEEQNRNFKLDFTLPFRPWSALEGKFKIGAFQSTSERTFAERQLLYPDIIGFDGNPNNYLRPDNLGYVVPPVTNAANGRIAYRWNRYLQSFDSTYAAASEFDAAYLMMDVPVAEKLRLIGGARVETTDLTVDSVSYRENSVTGQGVNHTKINQTDLLPAAGLIYSLSTNLNLRLNYSQTIARPSFREMAAYGSYDPVLDITLDGNPLLTMSSIENYDFRWEWFPRPGELLSFSFYYKELQGAIERRFVDLAGNIITFENRPTASVMGFEFEARKNLDFIHPLLREWSLGCNFSYIQSEVQLTPVELNNKLQFVPGASPTRPLYDQSPYILNLDLNYDNPRSGTSAALILNAAGPRIAIASLTTEDVYEHPPLTLDFVLSQKLRRNLTVKFTGRNLLNPALERTYGEKSRLLYSSSSRGTTYSLALTYDF